MKVWLPSAKGGALNTPQGGELSPPERSQHDWEECWKCTRDITYR